MIKIYGLEYTYYDHPGKYSLVLYTSGCNLKCYGCHNRLLSGWDYKSNDYNEISLVNPEDYHHQLSIDELNMSVSTELLDMVILCGGEFLIYNIEEIKELIDFIKSLNPGVLIRIDTNGTFPDKVRELINRGKIDGFAIDIKGPYWDSRHYEKICEVIGVPFNAAHSLFEKMCESINLAKQLPYTLYRSVTYPVVSDLSYFDEIKRYVYENLHKPHTFNTFVKV